MSQSFPCTSVPVSISVSNFFLRFNWDVWISLKICPCRLLRGEAWISGGNWKLFRWLKTPRKTMTPPPPLLLLLFLLLAAVPLRGEGGAPRSILAAVFLSCCQWALLGRGGWKDFQRAGKTRTLLTVPPCGNCPSVPSSDRMLKRSCGAFLWVWLLLWIVDRCRSVRSSLSEVTGPLSSKTTRLQIYSRFFQIIRFNNLASLFFCLSFLIFHYLKLTQTESHGCSEPFCLSIIVSRCEKRRNQKYHHITIIIIRII